jgi:hypothetical protein
MPTLKYANYWLNSKDPYTYAENGKRLNMLNAKLIDELIDDNKLDK